MQSASERTNGDDAITTRPLLRLPATHAPQLILDAGFGGVILGADAFDEAFARECRAHSLSVWLDLSTLLAPRDELKKQHLVFEDLKPHVEMSGDELDPLHPDSGQAAIDLLEPWSELLTGVLFDTAPAPDSVHFPPFPWSPHLSAAFHARHSFDIFHRIETLVSSGGDEAARVRQQYWDEVHNQHQENFLQPLRQWCAQQAIAFCSRHFHIEWNALALPSPLRARLDSASTTLENALPYPQTLQDKENFSSELNALLHAGSSTIARYEPHPIASPPQVLWNQVVQRSSHAFADSRTVARIGVLFPARSTQTHYHPDGHRFTRWVGDDLKHTTDLLDDLHFDWLFVTEAQLISATQNNNLLHTGTAQHPLEMIVVPSVTALSWQVWEKLERFVESGGRVACLGLLPRWSERGRDRALEARIGKATRIIAEDLYQAYAALEGNAEMPPTIGYPIFREYHSGGRLCCYQPRLNADAEDARLRVRQILHESLTPDFETLAPQIRYTHRQSAKSELYFVANDGQQSQRVNVHLRPSSNGTPIEIEIASGEEKPFYVIMPYQADAGGGIGLSFDLAPTQSRFLKIQNSELKTQNPLERATFEVEFYDNQEATGYMTQNGLAQAALRQAGQVEWFAGESVTLPPPLLAYPDEWLETATTEATEFSQSLTIPLDWQECRVFLEVAHCDSPLQCSVNGGGDELRLAPPFRFDITLYLAFGASNDFTLKLFTKEVADAPLARLVAYPRVTVKVTQ